MRYSFPVFLRVLLLALCLLPLGSWAEVQIQNADCLSCHDGNKSKLTVAQPDGEKRTLRSVAADKFAQSVHATMSCVACHRDITDKAEKGNAHVKSTTQPLEKVNCAACHEALWKKAQDSGKADEKPRLGVVAKNIEAYKASFHARPNVDDKTFPAILPGRSCQCEILIINIDAMNFIPHEGIILFPLLQQF